MINKLFIHLNNKILFLNKFIVSKLLFFVYYFSYQNIYKLVDKKLFDFFFSFSVVYYIKYMMYLLKKRKLNSIYNHIIITIITLMFFFIFICVI